jgi:hypothetical protein
MYVIYRHSFKNVYIPVVLPLNKVLIDAEVYSEHEK